MQNIDDAIGNEQQEELVNSTEVEQPEQQASTSDSSEPMSLDDALAKAFEKHTPKDEQEKPEQPQATAATEKTVDPITGREFTPVKAPQAWTAVMKEKWSSIDPSVQAYIDKREKEMVQNYSQTAEERGVAKQFREILSPYESTFRQYNVTAAQVTKDVMSQWHILQTGTPEHKAHLVHQILMKTQPDGATLTALLNGHQIRQPVAQPNIDELVEKRLAEREAAEKDAADNAAVAQFINDPANEYLVDVHEAMARMLNAQLFTGSLDEQLKQAYELACSNHLEISQIRAQKAAASSPTTRSAVKPVAQVKPSLGTAYKAKSAPKSISLDDALRQSFEKFSD